MILDNNYVVPYNKGLLIRYNTHINIEVCCQSTLIKYLFKYASKTMMKYKCIPTVIHMSLWGCVTPLEFPIHLCVTPVECLQIHLSLQHPIIFSNNMSLLSLLRRPNLDRTMLTKWFKCNKIDSESQSLYYSEFPSRYVWDPG